MATSNINADDILKLPVLSYPLWLAGVNALNAPAIDPITGKAFQCVKIAINVPAKSTLIGDTSSSVVSTGTGTGTNIDPNDPTYINPDTTATYGTDIANKTSFSQTFGMTVVDKTIILPMPNDYVVTASMSYSEMDPGFLVKAGEWRATTGGLLKDLARSNLTKLGAGAINAIKKEFVGEGKNDLTPDQLLQMQKVVENPKLEVMYTGFNRRRFTFQYMFAPKNQLESVTVYAIIQILRYYSLPELTTGRQFYIFPAQFELMFIQGNDRDKYIPKVAPCVLERVSVNYSPGGNVWSTLPNGEPVAISLTMELYELELIDRTRVWDKDKSARGGY